MKEFKKLFLWAMNMKFYMGIYFVALVLLVGAVTAIFGGDALSLVVLLEMMLASMGVAIVQVFILPDSLDLSKKFLSSHSVTWLCVATILIVVAAVFGKWFEGLPNWSYLLLGVFMFIAYFAMLIGIHVEQSRDTIRLNEALQAYKKK